jgi:DNA-binding transcriptional MocR family regulator
MWIELPQEGPTATELYVTAIQHGVAYAIGTLFYPTNSESGARAIRINFSTHSERDIHEGFRRLGQAWESFQSASVRRNPVL